MDITKLTRRSVQTLEPYKPSATLAQICEETGMEEKEIIKLDSGENSYVEFLQNKDRVKSMNFYIYPDPLCIKLREKLSEYTKVDKEWIMCGNGSDELIDLLIRIFVSRGEEIIINPPTFPMYEFYGKLSDGKVIQIFRKKDFSLDIAKIQKSISVKTKIVFIDSPGNPTSVVTSNKDFEKVLQKNIIVVADEAYFEYCGKSVITLLKKYPNLVILRTFSKWAGLAGLRVGYCIASPKIIQILSAVKSPYNVNTVAQEMACFALDDRTKMLEEVKEMVKYRKIAIKKLQTLSQLTVYPSDGAYIIFQTQGSAIKLQAYLKKMGMLVKIIDQPLLKNCIRLNIGKEKEIKKVIQLIKRFYINKYAFLDRDGTLIFEPQDTFQIDSVEKLKILDGAIYGLKELTRKGYELIMITNQDGLGTSSFPKANFEAPQNKMLRIFEENGITFKRIFICPHLPSENCDCRKPKTGLVKKFLRNNKIDRDYSFVCGDRVTDKQFAKNIGVKFIPIQTNGNFYNALMQGGVIV